MRRALLAIGLAAVLGAAVPLAAGEPTADAAEAQALFEKGRYAESLAAWERVIATGGDDPVVASGDAHWFAAQCREKRGEHAEAIALLTAYVKARPKGAGVARALEGIFIAWLAAGDDAKAQTAGKRVLHDFPDDARSLSVVREFVAHGFALPKLETAYDVLHRWTYKVLDWTKEPDVAIALLAQIEKVYPQSDPVRDGRTLYNTAWCHKAAKRYEKAIELWQRWLPRNQESDLADSARFLLAESCLALDPPDVATAKKHLAALLANPKSKMHDAAEKLSAAAESGGATVQITEGFPAKDGLGKVVMLTNLASSDPLFKALDKWREARHADVVRFKASDVRAAAADLRKSGPEFVAIVVAPATVDINFQLDVLEMSRELDADPMPDFHFGYLTAKSPEDLAALAGNLLAKGVEGAKTAEVAAITSDGAALRNLDCVLHFGHGNPWCVVDGASAEQIAAFALLRHPVVFSGACFNGVLSRSYHGCAMQMAFQPPAEIEPERLVSLAWVHAGATGLLASMEGDRGEMAMAEWAYFRGTAAPLGEVIGQSYRLAFTSLPETYAGFPRYKPGTAKRMGFYDVMLRGLVARILVSDPSYKPLAEPLDPPATKDAAAFDREKSLCTVTVEIARFDPGASINCLTARQDGAFDSRLTSRVALPDGVSGRLGAPEIRVEAGGTPTGSTVPFTRSSVRHEVWGGRRYVNVQIEGTDPRLAAAGTRATFTFAVK